MYLMVSLFGARGNSWFVAVAMTAAAFNVVDCQPSIAREFTTTINELDHLPQIRPDYPRPTDPNIVFYIQHSTSPNTVVYAARLAAAGQFDPQHSIDVFWRRYTSGGERTPLSFVERLFAYGVKVSPIAPGTETVTATLVSYPEKPITIDFDDHSQPRAMIQMGEHRARAVYAYVDVDESGLFPSVRQVDVFGIDALSGRVIHELIKP
jgi:hypothetical protein